MQNQINKSLPPFKAITSKPMVFINVLIGLFGVFFMLFFLAGIIFIMTNSFEQTGLDEIATVAFFF